MSSFVPKVTYFEHAAKRGRLEFEACAIKLWKVALIPRNKQELHSFLGLCKVHCCFVHNFARIAGPLNEMVQKELRNILKIFYPNK